MVDQEINKEELLERIDDAKIVLEDCHETLINNQELSLFQIGILKIMNMI